MGDVAARLRARAVFEEFGEVVGVRPGAARVRTALAEVDARRAVSCLVEPAAGDRVLLATEEGGDAFVLAVLERPEGAPTILAVDGDLELRAQRGKVTVAAQLGVDVAAGAPIRVAAPAVDVTAVEGRLAVQVLDVFGAVVKAELGKVKTLARSVDAVFERLSQRVRRSYRTVEEIDQVRARQIDYEAQGNARLHGENALVTAEVLAKVNGAQVHLG
ncbi:DUF3540 domain-containing protein [Sorangium sp. So ce1099]|uniref:DUF3540 domain-containing protein n=1 Tax=Sorangium sp. So ce1099 TaxID=3133331 RepID=UPI003F6223B9